jgi:hypothetical protein
VLDLEKGLMFFHAYMYGPLQGKLRLYEARDVSPTTVASPSDWEVFASILVGDPGTKSQAGIDLLGYEVKSAKQGSSFEYQYHRDSWQEKLQRDGEVGHLFFSHTDNLNLVELRYADGVALAPIYFNPWKLNCPYPTNPSRQRYRESISYGWVKGNGSLIMRLRAGEVDHDQVES